MTEFQVTIVGSQDLVDEEGDHAFETSQHSRDGGKIVNSIERLAGVWDQVVAKLSALVVQTNVAQAATGYELSSIEFSIGIEAGLNIGLVTKGDASVAITFSRKRPG